MLEKLPDAVGHALRDQRAGLDKTAFSLVDLRQGSALLQLTSVAFADHAPIPARYTADGAGLSPPLQWTGVPSGTASLALIVEDADAPTPQPLVHAIALELEPQAGALAEGALASPAHAGAGIETGRNSLLQTGWLPPDPPPGHGVHRYVFQLFALGPGARFAAPAGRGELLQALHEHAIASGCLIGTYERPDTSIKAGEPATAAAAGWPPTLAAGS